MMTYRINELFYSLQGEGHHTGRPAVFVRFAGCNLRCPFCDTDFARFREMAGEEIVSEISRFPARFVVLTGGEPTLQADEAFVDLLHQAGFEVAIETNGTRPVPKNIDWVTVSPKVRDARGVARGERQPDELKIVFDGEINPEALLPPFASGLSSLPLLYLQPCDVGDRARNQEILDACVAYIKEHSQWRLSLQTHKLAGFK